MNIDILHLHPDARTPTYATDGAACFDLAHLQSLLDYCPETGEFTRKIDKSNRGRAGKKAGSHSSAGYIYIGVGKKKYLAHRLAWLYVFGRFPQGHLDHINRDKTDNRIANLRECAPSENQQNVAIKKNNTSGSTGVYWCSRTNKWQAQIMVNRKCIFLGRYILLADAISARQKAVTELHLFAPCVPSGTTEQLDMTERGAGGFGSSGL